MKTIESVPIWDSGNVQDAKVLNSFATSVILNTSATFCYLLYAENADGTLGNLLSSGNLQMSGQAYADWEVDNYAWDWIAQQLNLTITGDYVPPVPPQPEPPQPESTEPEITEPNA